MLGNSSSKIFTAITCLLIISSCATVSGDFEQAARIDSTNAYEAFLHKHPDTEFEQTARTRLRGLEEKKQKEIKKLKKIEREVWEKTKTHDSISSYAEFLELYPKSKFAINARRAIQSSIQEIALTSVGGDQQKIRSGVDFPINIFSAKDIMKGFGRFYVGSVVTHETSQGSNQKISATMFRSYARWQTLYGVTVISARNFSSSKFDFDVRMVPVSATAVSSLHPGTTVTFYRHPEYKTSTVLRLSIHRKLLNGNMKSEDMAIEGVGIAILRKGNSVEVYEFTKGGASIFK